MWGISKNAGALALVSVGVVLGAEGCGNGRAPEKSAPTIDFTKYIAESCAFKPDEGEKVEPVRSSNSIGIGYFGKRYDRDWFRSVLRTSLRETVAYIESTGVRVYHAPAITEKSCRNLSFADEMPAEVERGWNIALRDVSDQNRAAGVSAFTSGLYLLKDRLGGAPTAASSFGRAPGVIIVREDANRWTLLHEFLHHNFKVQSIGAGFHDARLQNELRSLLVRVEDLWAGSEDPVVKARKITPLFVRYVEVSDELFSEYYLEEVAIEAMLQDAYDAGELAYVSPLSYEDARAFIEQSRKSMEHAFDALERQREKLLRIVDEHGLEEERKRLEILPRLKETRMNQFEALLEKRRRSEAARDSFGGGL